MRARGVGIGKAKFEFNVVDENGVPVPGARIGAGGYTYGPQFPDIEVFTNKRGKASFKLRSSIDAGANVTKTGYYTSNFEEVLGSLGKIEHGRWLPWPIKKTLVLKRKRNPIPMYAKHVRTLVPVSGEPVGFDLEKADWVAPHGEGKNSDFVFTITGTYEDWRNRQAAMTLNFSNERDGIQFSEQAVKRGRPAGSEFASAHEAPLQGYKRDYRYERVYAPLGKPDKNIASRLGLLGY